MKPLVAKILAPLVKSFQTGLLLSTGLAGYMSARCPVTHWATILGLTGSLFLAISGSTILNMWFDRDIDARMKRTSGRPIPSGLISPEVGVAVGVGDVSLRGWLGITDFTAVWPHCLCRPLLRRSRIHNLAERKTPWSIVWGGISGGMPVLAGRALGLGFVDGVGLLMAIGVLLWIQLTS